MAVHDEVTNSELSRSLARIESKLDGVAQDHEKRLRNVERMLYITLGLASAGATSGIGAFVSAMAGGG
jgi:hypothetical protein